MAIASALQSSTREFDRSATETQPLHSRALPQNTNWRTWSTLRIRARRLPSGVTTSDIHKNFEQYGNVVYIVIAETKAGGRSSTAEINFDPVPGYAFWTRGKIPFNSHGVEDSITVHLDEYQKPKQSITSPINDAIQYPPRIEVQGFRLDFGVLSGPTSMMIMQSCSDGPTTSKMLLDLKRQILELHFKFNQQGSSGRTKQRSFRCNIALDEKFSMWRVGPNMFVIHLTKTPPYTKLLAESKEGSHSRDGRIWSIEDMWARQADICEKTSSYKELESLPIALPKSHNAINIARWTTFCFHASADLNNNDENPTEIFLTALRDWNVHVKVLPTFNIATAPHELESSCWSMINSTQNGNLLQSSLHELMQLQIPFPVRYQLEVCVSHGFISEYSITQDFLEHLAAWPERRARQALVYVATDARRLYNPLVLFTDLHYTAPLQASKRLPENYVEIYSATVTATGILFHTPSIEISNRIIRKYKSQAHRFLRVRFEDDDFRGHTRLFPSLNNKMITIFRRVKRTLRNGITLGDIKYEFLAWGNSQLRDHGTWFVAATGDLTAERIRREMGEFKETVVAKKAARMGQCFSTTQAVQLGKLPSVSADTVIPDIKRGRFIFTDGVGKISRLTAQLVADQLHIKGIGAGAVPTLFQFRLGGCKGVLAVTNDIPGIGIQIRGSQFKFDSLSSDLEIIRFAQFWQPFLNRQIILCLSHLGVPTRVFREMQDKAVTALNDAMTNDGAALKALRTNVDPNQMTLNICDLVEGGFREEPFTKALLNLWRAWSLKYLKEKAKIPVTQGAFLLGTVDETAILRGHTNECPSGKRADIENSKLDKLPEIYVQYTDVVTGELKVVEGICILARNPSLHPGDIRVVMARNIPAFSQMHKDVVVMPQTGDRDLPSMCSGGDLDGDDYIVIWDPDLIPRIWNVEPFHYDPPAPREAIGDITVNHLTDFFHDYLRYDTLGRIATAHLAAADVLGLDSDVCHELASLHSQAVDYPKTGVPAIMDRKLERDRWPHFMEKGSRRQYHSGNVLGQLYDSVQKVGFKPDYNSPFDSRILGFHEPPEALLEKVQVIKADYDNSMRRTLIQHGIKTEFELWSTFVLNHSKQSKDFKFHEEVGNMSRVLKDEFYESLSTLAGGSDFDHLAPVAVAAYKLTQRQLNEARDLVSQQGEADTQLLMPFISFPWILQDVLIKIALLAEKREPRELVIKNGEEFVLDEYESGIDDTQTLKDAEVVKDLSDKARQSHEKLSGCRIHTKPNPEIQESEDLYGPDTDIPTAETLPNTYVSTNAKPVTYSEIYPGSTTPFGSDSLVTNFDKNKSSKAAAADDDEDDVLEPGEGSNIRDTETASERGDAHGQPKEIKGFSERIGTQPNVEKAQESERRDAFAVPSSLVQNEIPSDQDFIANQEKKLLNDFFDNLEGCSISKMPLRKLTPNVCLLWKQGQCRNSAQSCPFTHHDNGRPAQRVLTCWYWKHTGACHRKNKCSFAHWDTGHCALPPTLETRPRGLTPKRPAGNRLMEYSISDLSNVEKIFTAKKALHSKKKNPTKRTMQVDSDSDEVDPDSDLPLLQIVPQEREFPQQESTEVYSLGTHAELKMLHQSSMKTHEIDIPDHKLASPTMPNYQPSQPLDHGHCQSWTNSIDSSTKNLEHSKSGRNFTSSASGQQTPYLDPDRLNHTSIESSFCGSHIQSIREKVEEHPKPITAPSDVTSRDLSSGAASNDLVSRPHDTQTTQNLTTILDDPANHASDSDGYEVDEIFD